MILDAQLLLSDAQALTTTAFSTNAIDTWNNVALTSGALQKPALTASKLGMGTVGGNIHDTGRGNAVKVWSQVVTTLATGTSVVVGLGYATADDGTGYAEVMASAAISTATLVAGYQFRLGSLPAVKTHNRYLVAKYTIVGTYDAGAITTGIVLDLNHAVNLFV
jgi:hypothetical protein